VQDTSIEDYNPDRWASAWSLTKIQLPTGGTIEVEYEADDYAYVQNKPAMQMYPVVGAGASTSYVGDTLLYDKNYLYIERPPQIAADAENLIVKEWLLGSGALDDMYFRFLTDIVYGTYEYCSGYTKALDAGICPNDNSKIYIQIEDTDTNPISEIAWGYFRQNLFEVLYEQPNISNTGLESILRGLKANMADIAQMFKGVEAHLKGKNVANRFEHNESFVRLYSSDKFKLGGGSRVKRIIQNDSWKNMTGEGENSTYGREYDYTTLDTDGRVISSGVASYEPMIGNDENPFRTPVSYVAQARAGHIPAIDAYQEMPFGESFFPSAVVGYSKVTVKNIHYDKAKTSRAVTEHNFYTAKDFPVLVHQTGIQSNYEPVTGVSFNFPFSNVTKQSTYTASQGYTIIQ